MADTISMTQVAGGPFLNDQNVVYFSPDRSRFAVVLQKGNLANDTVEFRLLVFKTAEIFNHPRPKVLAMLASSSNREAISQLKWLADSKSLVFLGAQRGDIPQLFRVAATTGRLERLTDSPTPIVAYSMTDKGDAFIALAEARPPPLISRTMRRRGFYVTNQDWEDLYSDRPQFDLRRRIYIKTPRMMRPQALKVDVEVDGLSYGSPLSISPNGRYAFLRAYRRNPPNRWNDYQYRDDVGFQPSSITECIAGKLIRCPEQYLIVDIRARSIKPLLDAPLVRTKNDAFDIAAWTRQNSVLLLNTLLPLDSVTGEERSSRLDHVYAAEVTLPAGNIQPILEEATGYPAAIAASDPKTDRIVFKTGVAALGPPLEFRRQARGWKMSKLADAPANEQINVTLQQDINTPPKLVAHDPRSSRTAELLDLNPQFSRLTFGHVSIFRWESGRGEVGEGTLYYPPDYVPGKKYPLIIQTHDERRDEFWINGPYSTAYAAQPLANKGFIVLQMGWVDIYDPGAVENAYKYINTSEEGPHNMRLFQSAIDELDRRGLIDRNRVGLTGFSRTTYHVLYTLTHSKYHFAAAVAADGSNFGYVQCLYNDDPSSYCPKINGGALPFSGGLTAWAKTSPPFMLDKVNAPLLLQTITSPFEEWAIYSGLRWLKKPVELINFYPEGEHVLVRPQQRLLSEQSVVDWYCFWLQGHEDPDPAKAVQYTRWRKLRVEQADGGSDQTPRGQVGSSR